MPSKWKELVCQCICYTFNRQVLFSILELRALNKLLQECHWLNSFLHKLKIND